MRCVKKSKDGATVRADFLVDDLSFLVVSIMFSTGIVIWRLVERVLNAFVEDLLGVLWP